MTSGALAWRGSRALPREDAMVYADYWLWLLPDMPGGGSQSADVARSVEALSELQADDRDFTMNLIEAAFRKEPER